MKNTFAILSAAAVAAAVQPVILNSSYDVVEGEPFTLTFSGCESGCTITIETGPEDQQVPVQELTSSASDGEATVTVTDVPSGTYAFRITDNETGEYNFSGSFDYEGEGELPSTTATTEESTSTTEAPESTTTEAETTTTEEETSTTTTEEETSTTTTEEETTTSTPETTSFTTTTSSAQTTTESPTSTETEEETTTSESNTPETTVPDGAAGSLGRPMALVIGAVAAMLLLN